MTSPPTSIASTSEWTKTYRRMSPSCPYQRVAVDATTIDCASIILPMTPPELFAGTEMGEDALRVLRECLKLRARILEDVAAELPHLRAAAHWATALTRVK